MPPALRLDLVLTPLIDWYGALFPTLVLAKESCDRRPYRSHLYGEKRKGGPARCSRVCEAASLGL